MGGVKLKAATLVESLAAMAVVLVSCGIATMIFVNVMRSGNERKKLRAHLMLNEAAIKTKRERLFLDEEIRGEMIIIHKSVASYNDQPDLVQLLLTAVDSEGKIIESRKEIICTGCISD
jgi:hypothetical protein